MLKQQKTITGRYLTKKTSWLTKPIEGFLQEALKETNVILDPFVGEGDLLQVCQLRFKAQTLGLDILPNNAYQKNDSLLDIPNPSKAIIVTNPPYLSRISAKRNQVFDAVKHYYYDNSWGDLYLVALEKCNRAAKYVIALVPETFLNSHYPKDYLKVVSIIEDNPFEDTTVPICVVCFDNSKKQNALIFLKDTPVAYYKNLHSLKIRPRRTEKHIRYNVTNGRIALKGIDGQKPLDKIKFYKGENFYYQREKIKISSRAITYLEIDSLEDQQLDVFIAVANRILYTYREISKDILFSPFKGNNYNGKRRRRLDYTFATKILSEALNEVQS